MPKDKLVRTSKGVARIKPIKKVGKDEADLKKNYIYFRSPIGKALIGKSKKDLITVTTPSGEKNFEIKEVKYI